MHLFRHSFVSLRRAPTLAFTIIGTLGIALAATVIVFSFLNAFLLEPLPYGDASRVVVAMEESARAVGTMARGRVVRVRAAGAQVRRS